MQFTIVGIDLAKSVFQVHCLDTAGGVTRKKLRRSEVLKFFAALDPCLVGMESCATAHLDGRSTTGPTAGSGQGDWFAFRARGGKRAAGGYRGCVGEFRRPSPT